MAKKRTNPIKGRLRLHQSSPDDQNPQIVLYVIDRAGTTLDTTPVGKDGQFELSADSLKSATRVLVGPQVKELTKEQRRIMTSFRPDQFIQQVGETGIIDIARQDWHRWIQIRRCINGSVRHCIRYPWFDSIAHLQNTALRQLNSNVSVVESVSAQFQPADRIIAKPYEPVLTRCRTVCDGLVEVYRRVCCCRPWIIYDPRLPDLLDELEGLIPKPPWPPIPIPDPPIPIPDPPGPFPPDPIRELSFLKNGALDIKALHAARDVRTIRSLSPADVADYINDRPYLWCTCGTHEKVAQGFIQPSGDFNICWYEWPRLLPLNCHEEYAFVVKQNINGSTVVIYDGVSAGQWFETDEDIDLVSYKPGVITCGETEVPGEGAFVLLQDIGLTNSWRLKTPDASGWDRVDTPVYNDGLAFPAANPADALGTYKNRNWGGVLSLRYHFSEDMKSIAKYYRVSVVASDANGNPTGPRTYLGPAEWKYYEVIFPDIFVRKISLGPNTVGGQNNLYEIPYNADREWQSGQYHAILDTRSYANGRFLLTVEVFNSAGKLVRPNGTADPGSSVQGNYTYRRWYQATGPTAEVPYAALTHMLWWDNRSARAEIVDFRNSGSANSDECQFLEGTSSSRFSVGYRAYHPQPMFLVNHVMWWKRGLNGPTGYLTSPPANPNNVGVPPGLVHVSDNPLFTDMLGTHTRCTFTINLRSNVKTFNGVGTINSLDGVDQGSMALGIGD